MAPIIVVLFSWVLALDEIQNGLLLFSFSFSFFRCNTKSIIHLNTQSALQVEELFFGKQMYDS
jgi:hypothetical protein